ncbi:MAG: Asp23/Gls24 family envelope stress response protein [Clostridia bacterium]|nr:Asp23/Gls24 family envelope stress response protein [Clostridia bacterium]
MPQKTPQKTAKKDNLPVTKVDVDLQNGGTISYANEVIATIAGVAANEIEGIAGMCVSGGISDILGRNKNITRGVKVEVGSQEAAVDLYIIVEYGYPIQKVSAEVQENVRRALESLTGLRVVRVDVHVQGVSFEKEKKQTQNILEATKKPVLAEPETPAPAPEAPKEEPKPQEAAPETPAEPAAPQDTQEEPVQEDAEFDSEVLTEEASLEAAPAEAEQAAPVEDPAPEETPKAKNRKKTQPGKDAQPDSSPKRPRGRVRA